MDAPVVPLNRYLTGEALFQALIRETEELCARATQNQDVLLFISDIAISKVRFIEPYAFAFYELASNGERVELCHFSQVKVQLLLIRREPDRPRVITGFFRGGEPAA